MSGKKVLMVRSPIKQGVQHATQEDEASHLLARKQTYHKRQPDGVFWNNLPGSIYLSLDLDYWQDEWVFQELFDELVTLNLPTEMVIDHHHLLRHINTHKADILVNVDCHSDLAESGGKYGAPKLNDGTWGNHVRWRRKSTFVWLHPFTNCMKLCHCHVEANPFLEDCSEWKMTIARHEIGRLPLDRVKAIGLAVSPGWAMIGVHYDSLLRLGFTDEQIKKMASCTLPGEISIDTKKIDPCLSWLNWPQKIKRKVS
jgi:hypothetical protein